MQSYLVLLCVKAQDKLLQTPKTLSLQQCLIVCRHYESLRLHIQQIQPGSDKHIEFLCKHHPKSKKPGQNKLNKSQSHDQIRQCQQNQSQSQSQQQRSNKAWRKCYGCGHDFHRDCTRGCPAWGSICRKCNKPNHWEVVCGQIPPRRQNRSRQSGESHVPWLMKSGTQHRLIHRIPYQNRSLILLIWPIWSTISVIVTRNNWNWTL